MSNQKFRLWLPGGCKAEKMRFKKAHRASLVAQWLRIRLPMQGTRVRALVWEDPTCCRATQPVHHNYWACALEPSYHNYWARVPKLLKPACLEPMLCNKRSHRTTTKSSPCSLQLEESPRAATKTQHSQKQRQIKDFQNSCEIFEKQTP